MTSATFSTRDASWAERGATFTIFLVLGAAFGAWAAVLPGLKAGLVLTDRDISLALLALAGASVMSTLVAGALAPRIGTGRSTTFAALALSAALALPALAGNLGELIVLVCVFGAANGFLDVSMNGHASEIERRWGQAIMSSFHGAFSLGGLLGASFGGLMVTAGFGPTGVLGIMAGVLVVTVLVSALGLGPGSKVAAHEGGLAWPVRAAWGICAVALFCLLIEGAMADWSAIYLATVVRVSDGAAATGYAAFSVTMTAGRLAGDAVVRRLGTRTVIVVGGAVAALGLAAGVVFPDFWPTTIGFGLVGLGLSNITPAVFSAAGRFGRTPAAGIAAVVSVGYAGFIGGPPLIGAIASLSSLRVALGFLVAAAFAVVVAGFWFKPGPKHR